MWIFIKQCQANFIYVIRKSERKKINKERKKKRKRMDQPTADAQFGPQYFL
jgi:hypothetical protein